MTSPTHELSRTVLVLDGPLVGDLLPLPRLLKQVPDSVIVEFEHRDLKGVGPLLPLETMYGLEYLQANQSHIRDARWLLIISQYTIQGSLLCVNAGRTGPTDQHHTMPHLLQRPGDHPLLTAFLPAHAVGLSRTCTKNRSATFIPLGIQSPSPCQRHQLTRLSVGKDAHIETI